jgi:hypothetical protein
LLNANRQMPVPFVLRANLMSAKTKRSKYFVDSKVQGLLLRRAARYWFFSLALVGCLTVLGWVFITPGIGVLVASREQLTGLLSAFSVAVGVAVLLLPVALCDLLRVSNRFVGPVVRLRRQMDAAARGEHVEPVRFRDGDVWQEFANSFNALNERLQRLEADRAERILDVAVESPLVEAR